MNLFQTETTAGTIEFTQALDLAYNNNFDAIQTINNDIWIFDADGEATQASFMESVDTLSQVYPDGIPHDVMPQIILDDINQSKYNEQPDDSDEFEYPEFTEPGDDDYCIDCDIQHKYKTVILARLNDPKVIDLESAKIISIFHNMAY